jgi:dienelactone hydrolase
MRAHARMNALASLARARALFIVAALAAFPLAARAEQRVTFPAGGDEIVGHLSRPLGAGPFPAVVLLHSCLGLPRNRRAIADTIAGWGYVALFVDDFAGRRLKQTCAVEFPQGRSDAFAALAFLAKLPYVDAKRIGAVGYSQGADTALAIAATGEARVKAAAAFYPPCANRAGATLRIPTLILVGAKDDVTPAADCQALAGAQPRGADVSLVVYPEAAHGFDMPEFAAAKSVLGMTLRYDPEAAARSRAALRSFLAARLGR